MKQLQSIKYTLILGLLALSTGIRAAYYGVGTAGQPLLMELVSTTTVTGSVDAAAAQTSFVAPLKVVTADVTLGKPNSGNNTLNWYSLFGMYGTLNVNGQILNILNDLVFTNTGSMGSMGTINGNNYAISVSPRTPTFPGASSLTAASPSVILSANPAFGLDPVAVGWSVDGVYTFFLAADGTNDRLGVYKYTSSLDNRVTTTGLPISGSADAVNKATSLAVSRRFSQTGEYLIAAGRMDPTAGAGAKKANLLLYKFKDGTAPVVTSSAINTTTGGLFCPSATDTSVTGTRLGWGVTTSANVHAVAFRPDGPWRMQQPGVQGQFQGDHLAVVYSKEVSSGVFNYYLDVLIVMPDGTFSTVAESGKVAPSVNFTADVTANRLSGTHADSITSNMLSWTSDGNKILIVTNGTMQSFDLTPTGQYFPNAVATTLVLSNSACASWHPNAGKPGFPMYAVASVGATATGANVALGLYEYRPGAPGTAGSFIPMVDTLGNIPAPTGGAISGAFASNIGRQLTKEISFSAPDGRLVAIVGKGTEGNRGITIFGLNTVNPLASMFSAFGAIDNNGSLLSGKWSPVAPAIASDTSAINAKVTAYVDSSGAGGSLSRVRLLLNGDVTLSGIVNITDDSIIEGVGTLRTLTIPDGARIIIANGKTLTCNNVRLIVRGKPTFDGSGGYSKNNLDSIQFAGGSGSTATLKLANSSTLSFDGAVFIPQGGRIITDASGGGIQGKADYADRNILQDARQSFGGQIGDVNGGNLTLSADGTVNGFAEVGQVQLGGYTLTYNGDALPFGSVIQTSSLPGTTYPSGGDAFANRANDIDFSVDGRLTFYCTTNTTKASSGQNGFVRVDFVDPTANPQQLVKRALLTVANTTSKTDGAITEVDVRSRSSKKISTATGFILETVVAFVKGDIVQTDLTNGAVVKMYVFRETDTSGTKSYSLDPVGNGELVLPTADSTLRAKSCVWLKDGNFLAVVFSNNSTTHQMRIYKIADNGSFDGSFDSVRNLLVPTPVATVDLAALTGSSEIPGLTQAKLATNPASTSASSFVVYGTATNGKLGLVEFTGSTARAVSASNSFGASLKIAPHSKLFVAAVASGTNVKLIDLATMQDKGAPIPPVPGTVNQMFWSPSGETLGIASSVGTHAVPFNQEQNNFGGFSNTVGGATNTALMAPNGQFVVRDDATGGNGSKVGLVSLAANRRAAGLIANGTIKFTSPQQGIRIGGNFTVQDVVFDCGGRGMGLTPDAVITIKSGSKMTIKNCMGFGGLVGRDNGDGLSNVQNIIIQSGATLVLDNVPLYPMSNVNFNSGNILVTSGNFESKAPNFKVSVSAPCVLTVPSGAKVTGVAVDAASKNYDASATAGSKTQTAVTASGALSTTQTSAGTTQLSFDTRNSSQTIQASSDPANPTPVTFDSGGMLSASGKGKLEITPPPGSTTGYVQFVFNGTAGTKDTTGLIIDEQNEFKIPAGITVSTTGIGTLEVRKGGNIQIDGVLQVGTDTTKATDAVAINVADTGLVTVSEKGRASIAYGTNDLSIEGSGRWNSQDGMTEVNMNNGTATGGNLSNFVIASGKLAGEFKFGQNANGSATNFDFHNVDLVAQPTMTVAGTELRLTDPNISMIATPADFHKGDATVDPADALGFEHLTPGDTAPNLVVVNGTFKALPSANAIVVGSNTTATGEVRNVVVYDPALGNVVVS